VQSAQTRSHVLIEVGRTVYPPLLPGRDTYLDYRLLGSGHYARLGSPHREGTPVEIIRIISDDDDDDDDDDCTLKVSPRLFSLARRIMTALSHRKTRNGSGHDITTLEQSGHFVGRL